MVKKVLVIGLDGASFDLVEPWVKKGWLPNLGELMKKGVYANLVSSIQPSSEQAWTCFMTGVNNGKHGIYGFLQEKKGTHKLQLVNSLNVKSKSLWKILSENNIKVIVLNVPVTYPPESVNGLLVSGLMTPNENSQFTFPKKLKEEIMSVFADYKVDIPVPVKGNKRNLLRFHKNLKAQIKSRGLLTRYLMGKYQWDFLMIVFTALDKAQHKFWSNMQQTLNPFRECISDLYKQIDSEIGEILSNINNNIDVFIVSDHGFGPLHKGLIVNNLLEREGYLFTRDKYRDSKIRSKLRLPILWNFLLNKYNNLPMDLQDMVRKRLGWLSNWVISSRTFADIDWRRTKAYGVGSGNVRINLNGREPGGVVKSEEYEEIRHQIIEVLRVVEDPETGKRIFREIYKREDIYSGEYLEDAPDIVPHYNDGYRGILFGPKHQIFASRDYHLLRGNTGYHTMNGIFIASGPSIVSKGEKIADLNIIDAAPTILRCFGITPLPLMDGRVAEEVLKQG